MVHGTLRRIPAIDLTALAPSFMALALLTNATFAPAVSCGDNSDYVALGARSSYYIGVFTY